MSNQKTLWIVAGGGLLVVTVVLALAQLKVIPGGDFLGQLAGGSRSSTMIVACCYPDDGGCYEVAAEVCVGGGKKPKGNVKCTEDLCKKKSSSSSSPPPTTGCRDTDAGPAVVCGGDPCLDLQTECKPNNSGGCGCALKSSTCYVCNRSLDPPACEGVTYDDDSKCPPGNSALTCQQDCTSIETTCGGDIDPGTGGLQCGGDCDAAGTDCAMASFNNDDPSDDACLCLPKNVDPGDVYSCGFDPKKGSPSADSCGGDCPPTSNGIIVNCVYEEQLVDLKVVDHRCYCKYESSSSSPGGGGVF